MADELDLERGKAEASEPRKRTRTTTTESKRTASAVENELRRRLTDAFDKLADMLASREDEELATAIREEKQPMAQGFVSLTHTLPVLRTPLVLVVGFLELALAFGRVGGILVRRFVERRQRIMREREEAAQNATYESGLTGVPQ